MPLKAFTYPLPATRFVHAGRTVYKLKMRYSYHIKEDMGIDREQVRQELEDAIRAVLGNLDRLQPFTTEHFTIFPYKNEWERLSELQFKQGDKILISYPYVCTLYVELRSDHQHSLAAAGECHFNDCHPVETLTEKTVAFPVTKEASEEKPERSHLRSNRKRSKNALMKSINKENMVDSGTMSEKKRKKRAKTSTQAEGETTLQPGSWGSGKPGIAAPNRNDDGVKEQTTSDQKLGCDPPQAAAGGMLQFLLSPGIPAVSEMMPTIVVVLLLASGALSLDPTDPEPGCHRYPFNVTIKSDRAGTCLGSQLIHACVGYCESSAFPSKSSVLLASEFKHNITSVSQCCTISKMLKVRVSLFCGPRREDIEIFTAGSCRCDMCRLSRY